MSRDILLRRLGADAFFVSAFSATLCTCTRDRVVLLRRRSFVLRFVTRNGEILLLPCGSIPLFATAPFVSETSSLTVIHFKWQRMVLSETRGLWLSWIVREGIG